MAQKPQKIESKGKTVSQGGFICTAKNQSCTTLQIPVAEPPRLTDTAQCNGISTRKRRSGNKLVLQLRTTYSMGNSSMQRMWKPQARSRCYQWETMALASRVQKRNETKRRHGTVAEKRTKPEEPKGKVA